MSSKGIFGKEVSEAQAADYEQLRSLSPEDGDGSGAGEFEPPALEVTQCPACEARRFISKLLVYEETTFDEQGERVARRQDVRAEFEFSCGECQTILRTLPATRRDYYEDVHVLAAERQAALRAQLRTICGQVVRRLWAPTTQVALVLTVLVAVVVIGL